MCSCDLALAHYVQDLKAWRETDDHKQSSWLLGTSLEIKTKVRSNLKKNLKKIFTKISFSSRQEELYQVEKKWNMVSHVIGGV